MAVQLGKITREHDLRTVWSNEAQAFTPWLAEHLDVLGDALGITIELEERESSVGAFSLDILARDQDSAKRSRLKTKILDNRRRMCGPFAYFSKRSPKPSVSFTYRRA